MTTDITEPLAADAIGDIAALCRRSIWGAPEEAELRRCLFPPDQETVAMGDPGTGVVVTARAGDAGFVRLLVVAPDRRRKGIGRDLLVAAEGALRGATSVTLGADPPYSLWPGVPASDLALACLAESAGYERVGANVNMEVDLKSPLPPDPGGWQLATADHAAGVDALCAAHYPHWRSEAMRAVAASTLVVVLRDKHVAAFCAFDVNRAGTIGPVAVRPDLVGRGVGRPALVGALRLMRQRGHARAEIQWVGPLRPYAALGAKVGRVFHVYRKPLA